MRVIIDAERCESHGVCIAAAPGIFDFDETDHAVVNDAEVSELTRSKIESAVRGCPTAAISIEE